MGAELNACNKPAGRALFEWGQQTPGGPIGGRQRTPIYKERLDVRENACSLDGPGWHVFGGTDPSGGFGTAAAR